MQHLKRLIFGFFFPKRIKLVRQIAECHADDRDDDVGNGRPPLEHFDKEFQAEVVDENVAHGDEEIPHNLRSATQSRFRETDVSRHPKTRQESDGKLEHEGRDMGREGNEAEVENLLVEDEMVKNIVQHPFQNEVQTATGRIAEQLKAQKLAERRIEKADDRGQSTFYPGFYVFKG